jgi:hypothetical protein
LAWWKKVDEMINTASDVHEPTGICKRPGKYLVAGIRTVKDNQLHEVKLKTFAALPRLTNKT